MGSEGFSQFFVFLRFLHFFVSFCFFLLLFMFLCFSSLSSHSPRGQGQTTAIYGTNGEFHSDPVCTDPVQNFPKVLLQSNSWGSGTNRRRNRREPLDFGALSVLHACCKHMLTSLRRPFHTTCDRHNLRLALLVLKPTPLDPIATPT